MPQVVSLPVPDLEKGSVNSSPAFLHLRYLDGLRGLTALYIVLYHCAMTLLPGQGRLPHGALQLRRLLVGSGPAAVAVFIVLSGYCLALPTLQTGRVPRGFRDYLKRRALRILPAYYAALAGTLLIIWILPQFRTIQHVWWDHALPVRPSTVLAHFLLIQDLTGRWATKLNGPMWSISVEWQIYLIFPLILLPLIRRIGPVRSAGVAVVCTIAFYLIVHAHWLHPWFVGVFAMGVAGAAIGFRDDSNLRKFRDQFHWGAIALAAFVACLILLLLDPITVPVPWADLLTAVAAASLMVYCTRQLTSPAPVAPSLILRFLSARPLILVGAFSYSLYLTHAPVVAAADWLTRREHFSHLVRAVVVFVPGTIACLLVAYIFFMFFERPFLRMAPRHRAEQVL